jgi:hypothetical protein
MPPRSGGSEILELSDDARVYKRARKERRRVSGVERKARDRAEVERVLQRRESAEEPREGAVQLAAGARYCYVCHERYRDLDARYHLLCPACARLHEEKRRQRADLAGRRAIVTGGRAGIGRAAVLKLLRDGASVTLTTRFAEAARRSFADEPDHASFEGRLEIAALDLEDLAAVERFAASEALRPLDILVNNAALSVPYLAETIARLAAGEPDPEDDDPRDHHGWLYTVSEVPAAELMKVLLVNAAAPLLLVGRLRAAMARSPSPSRFVVNVPGTLDLRGCAALAELPLGLRADRLLLADCSSLEVVPPDLWVTQPIEIAGTAVRRWPDELRARSRSSRARAARPSLAGRTTSGPRRAARHARRGRRRRRGCERRCAIPEEGCPRCGGPLHRGDCASPRGADCAGRGGVRGSVQFVRRSRQTSSQADTRAATPLQPAELHSACVSPAIVSMLTRAPAAR